MPPSPFPPIINGTLSVIVPIYNEAATVRQSLDAILAKTVPGWTLQIIMVESNSTDGTRSIVQTYAAHPRVKLILEDRPRGKGHAVRAGLAHATGDVILIQDADLEYDLDDYDILLAPLAARRARHALPFIAMAFVSQFVQLRISWFDEQYLWETVFVLVFMLYMLIDQAKNGIPEDDAPEALPVPPPPTTDDAPPAEGEAPAATPGPDTPTPAPTT